MRFDICKMFPVVYPGGPTSSTTAEIYMQADKNTAYLQYYNLHNFGNDLLKSFIQFRNLQTNY